MPRSPRPLLCLAVLGLAVPLLAPVHASAKGAGAAKTLQAVDTDKDGSIDMTEATAAADATFDKLDKDKDGTLTTKELQGRISKKEMKAADPDDGKLDNKELGTPAGQSLSRLLK